jgi:hypothetical protein
MAVNDSEHLRTWQSALIPGLLQTPDYVRAILASWRLDTDGDIDAKLAARINRQAILDGDDPPDRCALLAVRPAPGWHAAWTR